VGKAEECLGHGGAGEWIYAGCEDRGLRCVFQPETVCEADADATFDPHYRWAYSGGPPRPAPPRPRSHDPCRSRSGRAILRRTGRWGGTIGRGGNG
jgi:hypothetical protein